MSYEELFQKNFFSNWKKKEQEELSAIKEPLKNSKLFFSFLSLLALTVF